jgi:hypothetical protein
MGAGMRLIEKIDGIAVPYLAGAPHFYPDY